VSAPVAIDAKMIETIIRHIPHCVDLGMRLVELGPDWATLALPYDARLVGDPDSGVLHGGAVTSVIDTVCGLAVMLARGQPAGMATLDLRIDYLRPATPGEELLARAECHKLTRNIAFVRGRAYHASQPGDTVAASAAVFMLEPADRPAKARP
jgi:uncharacterized protein (TIGR00369 family)